MPRNYHILCTICARGGSKGVKDKNIRPLAGRPLIAHTIRQALRWGRARQVVVSTDSEKIANIAKRYGAAVPFIRPLRLATDISPKLLSIRHALRESERCFREKYDIVVDLDVTAPVRKIKDLDNCFKLFIKEKATTLFSVVKAQRNPYFNMVEKKEDGFVRLCKKTPHEVVTRQGAPEVYSMNASIYFYARDFLLNTRHNTPFSRRAAIYIMDELSSHDIDSEIDFKFVEFLIKERMWKSEV
jgi:CMP-N-acetylneuraminic acid synthetase